MNRCSKYGYALIAFLCLSIAPAAMSAEVLSVDDDAPADYKTIQAAVDAARDGDTVVINPGTYAGPGNANIDLRSKAIGIQSVDPQDLGVVEATIIDCQGTQREPRRGFYAAGCNGAEISGLTITNGLAAAGGAIYCVDSTLELTYCRILDNATLSGDAKADTSGGPGGGICAVSSTVTLYACTIRGNATGQGLDSRGNVGGAGGDGGAVCAMDSTVYVWDCTIAENTAGAGGPSDILGGRGGRGAGVYGTRAIIERSTIEANTAGAGGDAAASTKGMGGQGGDGGGIFCEDSVEIFNSLVAGNRAGRGGAAVDPAATGPGGRGAGISCNLGVIDHCTIVANVGSEQIGPARDDTKASPGSGAGVFCSEDTVITNSILWDNRPDQALGQACRNVFHCDIEGDVCPADQGRISADPLFARPGRWVDADDPNLIVEPRAPRAVWVTGDYHLQTGSPCIDAGDPEYVPDPNETDLDGLGRLAGDAVDIGAYEVRDLVPVYRFWSSKTGKHFYTSSEAEKDKLVNKYPGLWTFEGAAYHAYARQSGRALLPVYRFWSDALSGHFWTISEAEKNKLIDRFSDVWTFEGPAFYAYAEGQHAAGAKAVHRFWSETLNAHFYTISEAEKNKLIDRFAHVWSYEGVAWYAHEAPHAEEPSTPDPADYEFTGGPNEALYVLTLKAYIEGQEAKIDFPDLAFIPEVGRMRMNVDLGGMTTTLEELHLESQVLGHTATISREDTGRIEMPFALSADGFFDATTPRGSYDIDPKGLLFPTAAHDELAGEGETFTVRGAVVLDGRKFDIGLVVEATHFDIEGKGTFDDSALPERLDVRMAGPFRWSRQGHEDLLLETTIKGGLLQLYVTSVRVQTMGLWRGKQVPQSKK